MAVMAVITSPNTDDAPDCTPRRLVTSLDAPRLRVSRFEWNESDGTAYVWVRGTSDERFESVLAADPMVSTVTRLESAVDRSFYKVRWEVDWPLIECVAGANGKVIEARGTSSGWQLKIWFEGRRDAATFQECCGARGIPLDVDQLKSLADAVADGDSPLTETQRRTIVLAHREGYFDEPRRISQEELADRLDISSSAVGGRLRRGLARLVDASLIE